MTTYNTLLNKISVWDNEGTLCHPQIFIFSGGEPHIKLGNLPPEVSDYINISIRLNSFNDVGLLLATADCLKRMGKKIENLAIPYFPAARQDRKIAGEAFTVKIYADIVNSIGAKKVTIVDPHSDVAPALINNVNVISQCDIFMRYINRNFKDHLLISPDMGASKKTGLLRGDFIQCSKKRDPETGALSGFKVHSDNLMGKKGIIVDDICDGGGTFIGLAKRLKEKGMKELVLCVTHGIFSKGEDVLFEYFDRVVTTNSISDKYKKVEIICLDHL